MRTEPPSRAAKDPARSESAAPIAPVQKEAPPAHEAAAHPEPASVREEVATKIAVQSPRPIVRLVDERTNEPVPFFALQIEPSGREHVAATTDVDGRVELPAALDTDVTLA